MLPYIKHCIDLLRDVAGIFSEKGGFAVVSEQTIGKEDQMSIFVAKAEQNHDIINEQPGS